MRDGRIVKVNTIICQDWKASSPMSVPKPLEILMVYKSQSLEETDVQHK